MGPKYERRNLLWRGQPCRCTEYEIAEFTILAGRVIFLKVDDRILRLVGAANHLAAKIRSKNYRDGPNIARVNTRRGHDPQTRVSYLITNHIQEPELLRNLNLPMAHLESLSRITGDTSLH